MWNIADLHLLYEGSNNSFVEIESDTNKTKLRYEFDKNLMNIVIFMCESIFKTYKKSA